MEGKRYSDDFKFMVATDALWNERNMSVSEIASKYGVSPDMVRSWKRMIPTGSDDEIRKILKHKAELESKIADL